MAAKVAAGLVRRGHQVRIVTAGMPHLPSESLEEGMEIRRLRAFRRREDTCSVPEMALWVLRAIPAVIAEVRQWKPDVIHAHFAVPTGAVAWVAHKATGVPSVLTAHLGDVPGGVPEQTGNLFRWVKPWTVPIWKNAAATTAVSSFVAGLAANAYGIRPKVILNGIDLPPVTDLQRHDIPGLLMVGRMSVQKNPNDAIRALAQLKDISWNMSVIGDGPLLAGVRAEAERLGVGSRIMFRGWASASEVSSAMNKADILLIPSLSEGLPMVAVEALTHGLAIVGSRIGGLSDVADDTGGADANARLYDLPQGPYGLAAALKPFLIDPDGLMSARRASLAKASSFDLNHALDEYEGLLQRVCR